MQPRYDGSGSLLLCLCECVATHPQPPPHLELARSSSRRLLCLCIGERMMEGVKFGALAHLGAPLNATFGTGRIRSTSPKKRPALPGISNRQCRRGTPLDRQRGSSGIRELHQQSFTWKVCHCFLSSLSCHLHILSCHLLLVYCEKTAFVHHGSGTYKSA